MFDHILYSNEFFSLVEEEKLIYVKVKSKGYEINDFKSFIQNIPRIKVTQFSHLRSAIVHGIDKYIVIGEYKPLIEIQVSKDRFTAYAIINMTQEEYDQADKDALIDEIIKISSQEGIEYGMDMSEVMDNMQPMHPFVIAHGMHPVQGEDAIIRLYEIEDAKPQIYQDGKVNHYELNLINKVDEGEWVGERIEPKDGIPGRTVFGEIVPALPGHQEKLIYDRKSIQAILDPDHKKTVLHARRIGAVVYENGVLSVCNYLEIDGKVSFKTGNVDFDGYVDIKDSVEDNFSVKADNDIQIMGDLGVGAVEHIESREGSIYIRGGIAGQNKAVIVCEGDLFTKFVADCEIICQGTVHIGYYAINAKIKAKEVILEGFNSRIIGGKIDADVRVYAGEIGSRAETATEICVRGFNRQAMREEYDSIDATVEKLMKMGQLLKQKMTIYTSSGKVGLEADEAEALEKLETEYERCQKTLKIYVQRKKNYRSYLQTRGEGEIRAQKTIYPNVDLKLKNEVIRIRNQENANTCYYYKNNQVFNDL